MTQQNTLQTLLATCPGQTSTIRKTTSSSKPALFRTILSTPARKIGIVWENAKNHQFSSLNPFNLKILFIKNQLYQFLTSTKSLKLPVKYSLCQWFPIIWLVTPYNEGMSACALLLQVACITELWAVSIKEWFSPKRLLRLFHLNNCWSTEESKLSNISPKNENFLEKYTIIQICVAELRFSPFQSY